MGEELQARLHAHRADGSPDTPRLLALDGLRGVAVLMVVVDHAGAATDRAGAVGVTVFFVLSGFLISRLIIAAHHRGEWSMRRFIAARAVRLLPALLVMEVVVGLAWLITRRDAGEMPGQVAASTAYVMNFYIGHFEDRFLLHTWSLAVEEQFYLLWPLLLPWFLRARRPVVWLLLLVAASMLGRFALAASDHRDIAFASLPTNAFALVLGCVLALEPVRAKPGRAQRMVPAVGLGAIITITLSASLPGPPLLLPIVTAPIAMAVVMFALPGAALLEARWLRFVGRISYALYLWHFPILGLASEHVGGVSALPWLALSFLLATASTVLVEEPLRRLWRRRSSSDEAAPAARVA